MMYPIFFGLIAPDLGLQKSHAALETVTALALRLNAQISVAVGALQITVPNLLSSEMVEGLIGNENKRRKISANALCEHVIDVSRRSGVAIHTDVVDGDLDYIRQQYAIRARVHGLVFAEAGIPGELLGGALIEPLIFESGRPVLVVPNRYPMTICMDHVVIGWDGSISAARAVWDSIPLLRLAKSVEIVTVTGEKDLNQAPAASTLAPMLSFLNKNLTVSVIALDDDTVAGTIKAHAAKTGAGLIVQGAYGRSRWREFVLGGVTREMLGDIPMPILMSH